MKTTTYTSYSVPIDDVEVSSGELVSCPWSSIAALAQEGMSVGIGLWLWCEDGTHGLVILLDFLDVLVLLYLSSSQKAFL